METRSRHIVVTGTGGGIGAALARHFLSLDWRVTGIDVRREVPADLAQEANFTGVVADITKEAEIRAAFSQAADASPIGAVIGNAAVTDLNHHHVIDLTYKTWQRIMHVNIDGAFLTAQCAAAHMRSTGGNIIFVTSSLARLSDAQAGDAPYCTSKAAVEMLVRVLAIELAPDRINVNTLFPSAMIDTGFFAHWSADKRAALSPPTILNETAAFLAGQPAGTATGRSLDQQAWDDDPAYRATWEVAP